MTDVSELVRCSREAQGLPPVVEDPAVLDRVTRLMMGLDRPHVESTRPQGGIGVHGEDMPPREDTEQYVYFIENPLNQQVKIGISSDVARRFAGLKTQSGVPLTFLGSCRDGRALEQSLHREFASQRLMGEWFEKSSALTKRMGQLIDGTRPDRQGGGAADG